jgi:hypothetical protein
VAASEAEPATRGAPSHEPRSDAIEAAALAAALAESALECECKEQKAGLWEYTPSHLDSFDDLYDPDFGSDEPAWPTDPACGRRENAAAESKQISGLMAPRGSAGS